MRIERAGMQDLNKILALQQAAYQTEAELLQNFDIPPLKQTLAELRDEYERCVILKATSEDHIVGAVRGHFADATVFIGKLMVAPSYRGRGIGSRLLAELEQVFPASRAELFTSSASIANLRLYSHAGYHEFATKQMASNLTFVYLEKELFDRAVL